MGWKNKGKKVFTSQENCEIIKTSKDIKNEDTMTELKLRLFLLEEEYKVCDDTRKKAVAMQIARIKNTLYLKSL